MGAEATAPGAVRPWTLPALDGPPTAVSIERVEQQAWQEGEARGYADGLERGAAEIAARMQALNDLIGALAAPLAGQDDHIAAALQHSAWTLAELLARSQLRHDPDAVARLVREAVSALAAPADTLTVQVAATQYDTLKSVLEQHPPAQPWQLEANPAIAPGDCKVVGSQATADATLDARLRNLSEQWLEGDADSAAGVDARMVSDAGADRVDSTR